MWDESIVPLMDALPVGVLCVDGDGVLTRANRPGLEYLGLDAEARGRSDFVEMIQSGVLRAALAAPANGTVRLNVTEGPRTLHAEVRGTPGGANGGRTLILRDVTPYANIALVRRNYFHDLLHKLRTPLTTVLSVLGLVTGDRVDARKLDLKEILGLGVVEAERLSTLLNRLSDLYLVETGELADEVMTDTVDVRGIVQKVAHRLQEADPTPKHEVRLDLPDEPHLALADADMLERAVQMVAENAFYFTPAGGRIYLAVLRTGGRVEIRVEDDGIGIPPEDLPRVFDRFHRGDSHGLRTVEGEGLGLYLARALLHAQGGALIIESNGESGTVAEILLEPEEDDA